MSNLPEDITEEEFIEIMSKCGMIARDPTTNKMKVKLYSEPSGQLKGDGLCHYMRVSFTFRFFFLFYVIFSKWKEILLYVCVY